MIYTPFTNLKVRLGLIRALATRAEKLCLLQKTGDMAVGQVSFHSDKKVKRGSLSPQIRTHSQATLVHWLSVHIITRDNTVVNRLNKTKLEKDVDHESERQERLREEGRRKKVEAVERVRRIFE